MVGVTASAPHTFERQLYVHHLVPSIRHLGTRLASTPIAPVEAGQATQRDRHSTPLANRPRVKNRAWAWLAAETMM
jgi:hypothetical protein